VGPNKLRNLCINAGVAIDQLEDIVTALLAGHVVRAHAAKDWGQAQLLPGTMTCLHTVHCAGVARSCTLTLEAQHLLLALAVCIAGVLGVGAQGQRVHRIRIVVFWLGSEAWMVEEQLVEIAAVMVTFSRRLAETRRIEVRKTA